MNKLLVGVSPFYIFAISRHKSRQCVFNCFTERSIGVTANMPVIYKSLQSILDIIDQNKWNDKFEIKTMLKEYDNLKLSSSQVTKKFPLIVIEGLDGCGKTSTAKQISKKIGAWLHCTPPKMFDNLRPYFDGHPEIRGIFYSLGNYIASLEMMKILETQPVILDRFWHSTVAYALAQSGTLPPKGDEVYEWPIDLLKPDAVYFLNVDEDERLKRISGRQMHTEQEKCIANDSTFRNNIIEAYRNMKNPEVQFIDGNQSFISVVDTLLKKIQLIK